MTNVYIIPADVDGDRDLAYLQATLRQQESYVGPIVGLCIAGGNTRALLLSQRGDRPNDTLILREASGGENFSIPLEDNETLILVGSARISGRNAVVACIRAG